MMAAEAADTFLDYLTVYIKETYHRIAPNRYAEPTYASGRPLNVTEECPDDGTGQTTTDGHRIVYVNEVFTDADQHSFRIIDVLGSGTFSYVFKCQVVADPSTFVALKIIKNLRQYRATGISEILVHKRMLELPDCEGKEHVINPISTFEIDGHVCMVMPLLYRSLFEGICQTQSVSELLSTIRRIMTQLLQALDFIHSAGIIHCDLKPDNILFADENFQSIKLIDFGSASLTKGGINQYIQSRFYRSPEIILGLPFNQEIDIWSAGCVAAELYLDFAIFACECESDAIHSMIALLGPIPEPLLQKSTHWQRYFDISPTGFVPKMNPEQVLLERHSYHTIYEQTGALPLHQLIAEHCPVQEDEHAILSCFNNFVYYLLNYDPNQRPSAQLALQHPFITGEQFVDNWEPPFLPRQEMIQLNQQMPPTASAGEHEKSDFLSMF